MLKEVMENCLPPSQMFPTFTASPSIIKEGPKAKFFVDALVNSRVLVTLPPTSCAPRQKGSYVFVKDSAEALQSRLDMCKFSLIGRLILSKAYKG